MQLGVDDHLAVTLLGVLLKYLKDEAPGPQLVQTEGLSSCLEGVMSSGRRGQSQRVLEVCLLADDAGEGCDGVRIVELGEGVEDLRRERVGEDDVLHLHAPLEGFRQVDELIGGEVVRALRTRSILLAGMTDVLARIDVGGDDHAGLVGGTSDGQGLKQPEFHLRQPFVLVLVRSGAVCGCCVLVWSSITLMLQKSLSPYSRVYGLSTPKRVYL